MADAAGPNRRAVDDTLDAFRAEGRITAEHAALVQLVQSLADACDREPRNASLWREYRGAVTDLGRLAQDGAADAFADLVNRLRSPVGDASN